MIGVPGSHANKRKAVNDLLNRFYEILEESDRYFTEDAKMELAKIARLFLSIYSQLSHEALSAAPPVRAWKMIPKFHMFLHLLEIQCASLGNPRFYWTYSDEDLMQIVKQIALSCHTANLAEEMLFKWCVLTFEYPTVDLWGID